MLKSWFWNCIHEYLL